MYIHVHVHTYIHVHVCTCTGTSKCLDPPTEHTRMYCIYVHALLCVPPPAFATFRVARACGHWRNLGTREKQTGPDFPEQKSRIDAPQQLAYINAITYILAFSSCLAFPGPEKPEQNVI